MEWAYVQIASLVLVVAMTAYLGLADARLHRQ